MLGQWWWTVDRWILLIVFLMIALGVWLSFGSSPAAAIRTGVAEPLYYALRQVVFGTIALGIVFFCSLLSPKWVRRVALIAFIVSILVMVLVLLPILGHTAKGAKRWIQIAGFTLQPSEFVKPALIVLVGWMAAEGQKGEGVPGTAISFGLAGLTCFLLLMQPDLGQTILVTSAVVFCLLVAGLPWAWIGILGGLGTTGLVFVYLAMPHVRSRLEKFINPEGTDTYQIDRASDAIASGALLGRGPGEGVMKRLVPDMHTDFIYSVAAEEMGLFFSLMLIALAGALVIRGLRLTRRLTDPYEQVAAAGLFFLFGAQTFINIAMNLKMIPTKGMTLPFISYGGSSMIAMGFTMGLALALTRKRPGAYLPEGMTEGAGQIFEGKLFGKGRSQ